MSTVMDIMTQELSPAAYWLFAIVCTLAIGAFIMLMLRVESPQKRGREKHANWLEIFVLSAVFAFGASVLSKTISFILFGHGLPFVPTFIGIFALTCTVLYLLDQKLYQVIQTGDASPFYRVTIDETDEHTISGAQLALCSRQTLFDAELLCQTVVKFCSLFVKTLVVAAALFVGIVLLMVMDHGPDAFGQLMNSNDELYFTLEKLFTFTFVPLFFIVSVFMAGFLGISAFVKIAYLFNANVPYPLTSPLAIQSVNHRILTHLGHTGEPRQSLSIQLNSSGVTTRAKIEHV